MFDLNQFFQGLAQRTENSGTNFWQDVLQGAAIRQRNPFDVNPFSGGGSTQDLMASMGSRLANIRNMGGTATGETFAGPPVNPYTRAEVPNVPAWRDQMSMKGGGVDPTSRDRFFASLTRSRLGK